MSIDGSLQAMYHPYGQVYKNRTTTEWRWTVSDHLGNRRLLMDDANAILSESHYYAFGLEMMGTWNATATPVDNDYLYNGKELQTELNLGLLDYGARFYDAGIGRFTGVDPLSDKFPHVSTYNYAKNSPVAHIDLWGFQAVRYSVKLENSSTFQTADHLQSKTPEIAALNKALGNQSKTDIFYALINTGPEGGRFGPFSSIDQFKDKRLLSGNLWDATNADYDQIIDVLSNLDEGKELLIIALKCEDNYSLEDIIDSASTLNHEEYHAMKYLDKTFVSPEQDHKEYYGKYDWKSPSNEEVLTKKQFYNSIAYRRLIQFFNDLAANPEKYMAPNER